MLRPAPLALVAAVVHAACSGAPPAPPRQTVTAMRPAVSWQGSGSRTLDFVSETGKFRLTWDARLEDPAVAGRFRLTVHSAVSGRPLREIADLAGAGKGSTIFEDDPRPYNLMIDSTGIAWSVSAAEIVAVVER